jgi:hypothetical protein
MPDRRIHLDPNGPKKDVVSFSPADQLKRTEINIFCVRNSYTSTFLSRNLLSLNERGGAREPAPRTCSVWSLVRARDSMHISTCTCKSISRFLSDLSGLSLFGSWLHSRIRLQVKLNRRRTAWDLVIGTKSQGRYCCYCYTLARSNCV